MFQKNAIVPDLSGLKKALPELIEFFNSKDYSDGVIEVYIGNIPETDVGKILDLLNDSFPKMKVIGFSVTQQAYLHDMESAIVISFTAMDRSKADLFYKEIQLEEDDFLEDCFSYARDLNARIKSMKNVKAIEIYFSYLKAGAGKFLSILAEGLEEVPVFGALAAGNKAGEVRNFITMKTDDSFIIGGKDHSPGVSGVIYSGEDLYVYEDYLFGWEPIGRYMDVSATNRTKDGTTVIRSMDGMKPIDVYNKYLGVEPNDYFVANIGEFPLVIERNGLLIGRTPSSFDEEGGVYLAGDIDTKEKVRFSYAEAGELLDATKKASVRMRSFGAERLSLIICGNRFNFLQDEDHLEIDYYSEGRSECPGIILGMGEIYMHKGKGGILNSALVAVGMREGLGGKTSSPLLEPSSLHHYKDLIPLSERLSHFLKAMTGELEEAVDAAKAANNAKSEFLSNMSHEIRTPINAVLGMDEMILRECDDPVIQGYAHDIRSAGNTLVSIINDILDFSKIESGKMDVLPVDYDFSSVLNDLIHMIMPKATQKGLSFVPVMDRSMPSIVNGDEIRIKQCISNLLSNALKYTEKGTITFTVSCMQTHSDSVDFLVSVKDTGIGIREDEMEKLFNSFQRVDEERNRTIEGTGLGLNITQKLLNLMDSELHVESKYGEGSEFYFVINQKVVKWDPVSEYMESYTRALFNKEAYKEKFTAPEAEILVVDDTPINITVFKGLLKKTLVHIDEALSGRQCLEVTREKKYDLIFLDHRMPEMDGIETLTALQKEADNPNLHTPVISLTANAISGAREMYIQAGFIDYLSKPIMSDKLETLMIRHLPKEKVHLDNVPCDSPEPPDEPLPDWLKQAPGIDCREGLNSCGSAEMYLDALESFADAAPDNKRLIEEFFNAGAIPDYTIKVHALKSSARIIGAKELSELAKSLEKAGDDGDLETINRDTLRLLEMYEEVCSGLTGLQKEPEDDSDLPPIDPEQLREAFSSMKELAMVFDYDSIKFIMDGISSYRIPDERKDLLAKLKDAMRNADWDMIKETLDEF